METIEEQSGFEDSRNSSPPPKPLRICLIGDVNNVSSIVDIAGAFEVPVIKSATGAGILSDTEFITYFIVEDFDSPIYEEINRSKHRILGPSALQQAVQMKEGLTCITRPIFNYSMRGVITCFTGIRKKDELIRLVRLIHSMGGSVRKDMNPKVTHLICSSSGGEKYKYAMTFRLHIIRPSWVYSAWEKRNIINFNATDDDFIRDHKLEAFEGQRICFFGFASDEHDHMVDVLKKNGGISTDLDDPECTHVIMASTGGNFPEQISHSQISTHESFQESPETKYETVIENRIEKPELEGNFGDIYFTEPQSCEIKDETVIDIDALIPSSTPQKCEEQMLEDLENVSQIEDNYIYQIPNHRTKRKRDSFGDLSILSTDSMLLNDSILSSTKKKPKLIRTSSITRSIKRSMSFATVKTPLRNLLGQKRGSIDPNTTVESVTFAESMLNESMKNHVKEKFRNMRKRISRTSNPYRKEINITPKTDLSTTLNLGNLSKICKLRKTDNLDDITQDKYKSSTDSVKSNTQKLERYPYLKDNIGSFSLSVNIPEHQDSSTTEMSIEKITNESQHFKILQPLSPYLLPSSTVTSDKATTTRSAPSQTNLLTSDTLPSAFSTRSEAALLNKFLNNFTAMPEDLETVFESSVCDIARESDLSLCSRKINSAVVDEHTVQTRPEPKNDKTHIVKADWFWYTIQNGYADEMDYLYGDYLESISHTPGTDRRDSLPISFNKRKRKRNSQRLQIEGTPVSSGKRRSSVSDAGLLSMSNSFLDCTTSPEKHDISKTHESEASVIDVDPKKKSMRYNHFMDLYNTESNYVGILDTILKLFKIPLEEKAETNDALLNKSEVRAIFNNFLPIHDVHQQMLERFRELQMYWNEDCVIGQVILNHRDDLIKAYPPYINFFEQMKEALVQCDTQNPRFHAFLKINQAKPECGRQTLQDLMIRPVQRLPSISLLLNDILKNTHKNNPDHKKLEEALKAIKDVMAHINEDKRKTEGQLAMFDIFNDIEGCPAQLVSSHRNFVTKCEVTELSDSLSGRGDSLVLYMFSDTIEVCKKRSRGFNTAKSPSTTKTFKHVKLMPLSSIRFVIDICDSTKGFALNCCRHNQDSKEKFYSFLISDDETDKMTYLRSLCKQMAENACWADTDKSLFSMTSQELNVDLTDVHLSTLSKAFKFATRTRIKVGRAFSFNKTPSKLKRAVSTMMTSPFGSTNSLTPASQLAQMKLASCTNINELGEEDSHDSESQSSQHNLKPNVLIVPPMSVQPTRKKPSTVNNIKRL